MKDIVEILRISGLNGLLKLADHSKQLRNHTRNFAAMNCLIALERCNLNSQLLTDSGLDIHAQKDLDGLTLSTICEFLYEIDILDTKSPGIYRVKNKQQFQARLQTMYACLAYLDPVQVMDRLLKKEYVYGQHVARNDHYDAVASATLTSIFSFGLSKHVLDMVEAKSLMDLGSGTGEYLAFLEKHKFPGRLYGMDNAEDAIAEGKRRGYESEQTQLLVGNIFDLSNQVRQANIPSVDIFSFMFVLHEFEDRQIRRILNSIKEDFPQSKILLTEITMQTSADTKKANRTVFPELKFVHQLSKQILRTPSEWTQIFSDSNFIVTNQTINHLTNQMCFLFAQQ